MNASGTRKFRKTKWLISAILCEISRLQDRLCPLALRPHDLRLAGRGIYADTANTAGGKIGCMYHYNPSTALEELTKEATLPNPVHVRDMMLRKKLNADQALELNRIFVEYQKFFGETQKLGKEILKRLAA